MMLKDGNYEWNLNYDKNDKRPLQTGINKKINWNV